MKTIMITLALAAVPALALAAGNSNAARTAYEFRLNAEGADTAEGAARIYADIRRHAVRVCRPLEQPRGMATEETRACRREVTENAVAALGAPRVAALWREDEKRA